MKHPPLKVGWLSIMKLEIEAIKILKVSQPDSKRVEFISVYVYRIDSCGM